MLNPIDLLRKFYLKVGFHTAAPNTLLGRFNSAMVAVVKALAKMVETPNTEPALKDKHWYKIEDHLGRRIPTMTYGLVFQETLRENYRVIFDLDYAVKHLGAKSLHIILFMGIGDYFFITPFLRQIKNTYPHMPIIAHVSDQLDSCNSPMVAEALKLSTDITEIRFYKGELGSKSLLDWRNYDYHDALSNIEPTGLAFPALYAYNANVRNRSAQMCRDYGLEAPATTIPIVGETPAPSEAVDFFLKQVAVKTTSNPYCGIVFLHLETRSSNYTYPHTQSLIKRLSDCGYVVISITSIGRQSDGHFEIDIKKTKFGESVKILQSLSTIYGDAVTMITTPSVFGAVSSGLGIKNLQLQHRHDLGLRSLWYPNLTIMTPHDYPAIPEENIALTPSDAYEVNPAGYIDYTVDHIMQVFKKISAKEVSSKYSQNQSILRN